MSEQRNETALQRYCGEMGHRWIGPIRFSWVGERRYLDRILWWKVWRRV